MKGKLDFGLYFITDSVLSRNGVREDVKAALRAGVRIVQYREKFLPKNRMLDQAMELCKICRQAGALFIVNDFADIAMASGADGIHIGPDDMPLSAARKILGSEKIIGVSAGSVADAKRFEKEGADYIGLGPVFATQTKSDAGKPVGLSAIKEVNEVLRIPFVAIGGISRDNLDGVLDAGAKSVCMISAILKSKNIEKEVREIMEIMHEHATRKSKK